MAVTVGYELLPHPGHEYVGQTFVVVGKGVAGTHVQYGHAVPVEVNVT